MVFPLDVTTPPDSYAWNYRDLATLLIISESFVMPGTPNTSSNLELEGNSIVPVPDKSVKISAASTLHST